MRAHIQRQGNHWVIILPDDMVEAAGLREGSVVEISFGHAAVSTEAEEHRILSLDELLARSDAPGAKGAGS